MQSRASIAGHPLHPIFVTIPIGLWSFVPICDIVYLAGWGDASWKTTAFYCIAGGLAGAVPAIITGLIDYPLAQGNAGKIAQFHLIINVVAALIFAISLYLRYAEFHPNSLVSGPTITFFGAALLGVSGWLGGELVSRFGISVHRDAFLAKDN